PRPSGPPPLPARPSPLENAFMIGPSTNRSDAARQSVPHVPEWIVCAGCIRPVADGLLACPAGFTMLWTNCLHCRHLEGAQNDRQIELSCSTDGSNPSASSKAALVSLGALIVELL